ncbi:MAG TPA: hypothetical protein VFE55_11075 [Acidimicrobiia bacterium]|nr:hypothetical protein [Acidimicrobiia bacterium]
MATRDATRRPARGLLIGTALAVAAAAGLAACSRGGSGSSAATKGRPAAASTQPASTTQGGTEPCSFSGAADPAEGAAGSPTRLLTDVRVGVHDCFERVTFEFKPRSGEPGGPVAWKAAYQPGPVTEDGSGRPVPMKGAAFLVVHFSAQGADLTKADAPDTYTGPTSLEAAGATRIQQVRRTGDFEGVLTWVIGVDRQRPFHVSTEEDPTRVVIDVGD